MTELLKKKKIKDNFFKKIFFHQEKRREREGILPTCAADIPFLGDIKQSYRMN